MSLTIRQRIFALTDTYDVCDHTGTPRYSITTELFTIGHRIHIFEAGSVREVGNIRERITLFIQKAVLSIRGVEIGVRREITLFTPYYTIDNGWSVSGDFLGWDYDILNQNGAVIAHISRELFHLSDTYTLTVVNPADELAAMMIAITIDMMNCRN